MLKSSLLFALALTPSMVVGQTPVSSTPANGQIVAAPTMITLNFSPSTLNGGSLALSNQANGASLGPPIPGNATTILQSSMSFSIPSSIAFAPGMVVRVAWSLQRGAIQFDPYNPTPTPAPVTGVFNFTILTPPKLMSSLPASNAILTAQPSAITLIFNTPIDPARSTIALHYKATATGTTLPPTKTLTTGALTLSTDKTKLTTTFTNPGDPGQFTVSWQATSATGAIVSGTFSFLQK